MFAIVAGGSGGGGVGTLGLNATGLLRPLLTVQSVRLSSIKSITKRFCNAIAKFV